MKNLCEKEKETLMKTMLLSICILFLTSFTVMAACNKGTIVNGYCVSNRTMLFEDAIVFCKENGLHLAQKKEVCPLWDGSTEGGECPIISTSLKKACWTAFPENANFQYLIYLSSGLLYRVFPSNQTFYYALCR